MVCPLVSVINVPADRSAARSARRKRWICFGIFVFVIAVLALVLGLYFGVAKK